VAEEDLVLAWYDEAGDKWVELDGVVDTGNNTITASIEHFTTFAIIGVVIPPEPLEPALAPAPAAFTPSSLSISPVEVNIGDEVTISLFVVNTGGKSGSYEVTLKIDGVVAAVISTPPTSSTPPSADETSSPPPTKEINWPVLWGVIGGVVVVGLFIFFLVRRKAY